MESTNYAFEKKMASAVLPKLHSPQHQKTVFCLYKKCLRTLTDHLFTTHEQFNTEARKIRQEFEAHWNETDPAKVDFLVKRAEYWLEFYRHPQPYTGFVFFLNLVFLL